MKKIISVLLCAVLLVGLIPMSVFATEGKIEKLTATLNSQCSVGSDSYEDDRFRFTMTVDGDSNEYIYAIHSCENPNDFFFDESIYLEDIGTVMVDCVSNSGVGFDAWCFEGKTTDSSWFSNAKGQVPECCYEIVKLNKNYVENANVEETTIDGYWYEVIRGCTVYGYTQVIPDAKYSEIYLDSLIPGGDVVIGKTLNLPRYDIPATFVGWYGDQNCTVEYAADSQDCYAQFKMSTSGVNFPNLISSYAMILGTNRNKCTKYDACDVKLVDGDIYVTFTVDASKMKQITCPGGYEIVSGAENGHALPENVITIERTVEEGDHKFISSVLANGSQIHYWHSERSEDEWNAEHDNTVRFTMPDEDVTLSFETCEKDKFIIDANGGVINFGDNGVLYLSEKSGQRIEIKDDCCTREGYKLVCLNEKADGSGESAYFDAEGVIVYGWYGINDKHDEATLYAIWEKEGGAEVIPGDTNGDGAVDNKDVVVLFRYVSSASGSEYDPALDFNGDGAVDNKDVVALFRYVSAA